MRPRSTASFTTSSILSRVSMIRLSGRMTPRVIASRSSATFLPEKSTGVRDEAADAALAAPWPALRAPLAAVCWRPRALPPALAARLRAGVLAEFERLDDPERLEAGDRLDDPDPRGLGAPGGLLAPDFRGLGPPRALHPPGPHAPPLR